MLKLNNQNGFGMIAITVMLVLIAALGTAAYLVYRARTKPVAVSHNVSTNPYTGAATNTSNTVPSSHQILAPQTVPSVAPECTTPITTAQDGNVYPLFCSNGALNVAAWNALAIPGSDAPMALGRTATENQIVTAECSGHSGGTGPIAQSQEELAAAYNGWSYSSSQVENLVLADNNCTY